MLLGMGLPNGMRLTLRHPWFCVIILILCNAESWTLFVRTCVWSLGLKFDPGRMVESRKRVVWTDGCFDVFHYGHANALRQSKELGSHLIAGVHSSVEISREKGLPVMEDEERYEVVRGCRYVDKVVENSPFVTQMDMVKKHGVDVVVHGDDLVLDRNGQDSYSQVRKTGMFREVKRTIGISTTEIVGRMLLNSRGSYCTQHPLVRTADEESGVWDDLLELFRTQMTRRREGRVVFVDGNFDLFHAGHTTSLRITRELGDYLVVGVHDDETTKKYTRTGTVMNVKERMLAVMSCRHVDEVMVSPYNIGRDFVERNGIDVIGPSFDSKDLSRYDNVREMVEHSYVENRFAYLSAEHIVNRIISNYQEYISRQRRKGEDPWDCPVVQGN